MILASVVPLNSAFAILINPDFETGDLTGWDVFETCTADLGCGEVNASVVDPSAPFSRPSPFETFALALEVGTTIQPLSGGGGVRTQGSTERSGRLDISADVAVSGKGNLDGGTVRLFFGSLELDNWSFGQVTSDFEYATLQGSVDVTAFDAWDISLTATRVFGITTTSPLKVIDWFDGVRLSGPATQVFGVSEPPTLFLFAAGIFALSAIGLVRTSPKCRIPSTLRRRVTTFW